MERCVTVLSSWLRRKQRVCTTTFAVVGATGACRPFREDDQSHHGLDRSVTSTNLHVCLRRVLCCHQAAATKIVGLIDGVISFLEVTVIELGLRFCVPASKIASARFAYYIFCDHQGLPMPFRMGSKVIASGRQQDVKGDEWRTVVLGVALTAKNHRRVTRS